MYSLNGRVMINNKIVYIVHENINDNNLVLFLGGGVS